MGKGSAVPVASSTMAVLRAFLEAVTLVEPAQQQLWSETRLTLTQLRVLRHLRHGPLTVNRIAQDLGHAPPSMTKILDRLEERRLVSRRRGIRDRRCVEVGLEPAGTRIVTELQPLQVGAITRALERMGPEELKGLLEGLQRLAAGVRALEAEAEGEGGDRT